MLEDSSLLGPYAVSTGD